MNNQAEPSLQASQMFDLQVELFWKTIYKGQDLDYVDWELQKHIKKFVHKEINTVIKALSNVLEGEEFSNALKYWNEVKEEVEKL
jgi:hypothetical protein